jgi:hypothetical protein
MSCFDNIISLEELCTVPTPTSGFYLNQIGINKSEIEQLLTKDYSSVEDFVEKKSAFAIQKVTSEIYSYLSPYFKANSVLSGARVGYESDQKELLTQSGYVGIKTTVKNAHSFIDFVISDISVFADYTGDIPVYIYDVKQGKLLATITVASIAGQISVSYDKAVISSPRKDMLLWIGYDSDANGGISSYKTLTHNGCSDCSGFTFSHRFIQATGSESGSPFTEVTLTSLTHTAGISFNYSVECNHTDWLCNHRNILGLPFLYKTGIEICNHALLAAPNQRTMAITTVTRELMEQKLAYFTTEYDRLLSNILRNMQVPQDKNCFNCSERITSRTTLA